MPNKLNEEEVLRIHYALVEEFAETSDPISPAGVKSHTLLGSAVSRQFTSLAGIEKYPDPYSNAATLAYGLCCDHPFHNGNKRTSLVAMLVHLHRNRLTLVDTKDKDLYRFILDVAEHKFGHTKRKRTRNSLNRPDMDDEIEEMAAWVRKRSKKITKGEQQITYRELDRILRKFGFWLENPKNNVIDILKTQTKRVNRLFSHKEEKLEVHVATIPFPGMNRFVSIDQIKHIRKVCHLRTEDGVDKDAFYGDGAVIDSYINKYRNILDRLASK